MMIVLLLPLFSAYYSTLLPTALDLKILVFVIISFAGKAGVYWLGGRKSGKYSLHFLSGSNIQIEEQKRVKRTNSKGEK